VEEDKEGEEGCCKDDGQDVTVVGTGGGNWFKFYFIYYARINMPFI
jgi:hypothetical protein